MDEMESMEKMVKTDATEKTAVTVDVLQQFLSLSVHTATKL
jgi:hypothetical protein